MRTVAYRWACHQLTATGRRERARQGHRCKTGALVYIRALLLFLTSGVSSWVTFEE
jgi:hypothetical protein